MIERRRSIRVRLSVRYRRFVRRAIESDISRLSKVVRSQDRTGMNPVQLRAQAHGSARSAEKVFLRDLQDRQPPVEVRAPDTKLRCGLTDVAVVLFQRGDDEVALGAVTELLEH